MAEITTIEEALEAVSENGFALQDVPVQLRTGDVCDAAVYQDGRALVYVPENLKTPELCMEAVGKEYGAVAYKHVPEALRSWEMCFAALNHCEAFEDYNEAKDELLRFVPRNTAPRPTTS